MTLKQELKTLREQDLSERRNIMLVRSRLALAYIRRGRISAHMYDKVVHELDVESKNLWPDV